MVRFGNIRSESIKIYLRLPGRAFLPCRLALVARAQNRPAAPAIPHLEKRGQAGSKPVYERAAYGYNIWSTPPACQTVTSGRARASFPPGKILDEKSERSSLMRRRCFLRS